MTCRRLMTLGGATLLSFMTSAVASADTTLWCVTRADEQGTATLATIDIATGAATPQFTIAVPADFSPGALAYDPASNRLFSLSKHSTLNDALLLSISLDTETMSAFPINGLPVDEQRMSALEFDVDRNQLLLTFGETSGFVEDRIAELSATGDVLQLSPTIGLSDIDTFGYDALNNRLIACDFNANDGLPPLAELLTIFGSPSWTGIANPPTNGNLGDAAVHPDNGRFFATGFDANNGYLEELTNGLNEYTTIGPFGLGEQVVGMAFVYSVCPADFNNDGAVDVTDLLQLLAEWGDCAKPCDADINNDGSVDVTDLLSLLASWGPCP